MKKVITFLLFIFIWIGVKAVSGLSLVEWINQSFLVGIISLLVWAMMVIFRSGFLSLFFKGFRIIGSTIAPKPRAMEQTDRLIEADQNYQSFKKTVIANLAILMFLAGFSSITVSVFGLILY
ncbi:DUF3899 domain-containing protein [Neobacillus dielmonensis]|uniref:DUF3899 domain-containing protein n=1 Tax=Neobacillus dielmonensis TaxID=1347369 RepID=UPI0005A8F936|nr:DUF3899 domain-containing protein [Neobacillus dielmonensis]